MKIKFNEELLLSLFPTEGKATLIGSYDSINGRTKIQYKCADCKEDGEKYLSRLYASGAYCKKCTYKRGSDAGIKTLQEHHGTHIKNPMDIPGITEKISTIIKTKYGENKQVELGKKLAESRKEHWENQKSKWKEIENKGLLKCRTCKVEKTLNCFQKGIRNYNTWNTKCNDCKNIKRASNRKEWSKNAHIDEILEELLKSAKRRGKQKERYNCTITLEELKEIYNKQSGKCYISGRTIKTDVGSPDRISLDRIDSNKGYTKDNVGLACIQINIMKLDIPLDLFAEYIKDIYENNSIF